FISDQIGRLFGVFSGRPYGIYWKLRLDMRRPLSGACLDYAPSPANAGTLGVGTSLARYAGSCREEERAMATTTLEGTARALVASGRGLLAADESHATIGQRFEPLGIANTEEHRRHYRQMLFTTKDVGDFISGVILFDETIRQASDDGRAFVEALR